MFQYQNLKFLYIFLFIFVFLGYVVLKDVSGQNFSTNNYSVAINISQNGSATFRITRSIENNDSINLIDGYEYVFPAEVPDQIDAKLGGENISYEVIGSFQNYSKVHFNFSNVVKPGETRDLEITATVKDFMKSLGQLKYFTILASNDEKVDLTITFPLSFEEPSLITSEDYSITQNVNSYQLTLFQPDSLLVLWPNEYDVNIKNVFSLTNSTDNRQTQLFPVINENTSQKVYYHTSLQGTYGLIDEVNNWYSVYDLQSLASREIEIEATIKKTESNYQIENKLETISWPENEITKDIDKLVEGEPVLQNKMVKVYNYLRNKKNLSEKNDNNFTSVDDFWNGIAEKESYTSFEYCLLLSAFASNNNISAQMDYGYELIASNFFPKKVPQFWCTFEYPDGQVQQYDFVTHSVYGFDLHTLGTSITKLSYGTWTPDSPVSDPLGLLVEDEYILNMEFLSDEEYTSRPNNFTITPGTLIKATSGFFHNMNLSITNSSERMTPITDLSYEGRSYKHSFNWDGFKLALLPNQVNNLEFRNLRIENFLFKGVRQVEVDLSLDNEDAQVVSTTILVEYTLDVRLVLGFIALLSFLLFFILMVIWLVFIKRKEGQYMKRGMY